MDLGLPSGFIMPFADSISEFGGLLEKLVERRAPALVPEMTALWNRSFKNRMHFHNEFTGENITTLMTAQEYPAARLIVHGATYAEAAKFP